MAMTCWIMIFMLSLSGLLSQPRAAMLAGEGIKTRFSSKIQIPTWSDLSVLAMLDNFWPMDAWRSLLPRPVH